MTGPELTATERAFVDGARAIEPEPKRTETEDAEILDFGYGLCGLLTSGRGHLIVEPEKPYHAALIALATSTLCPEAAGSTAP